MAGRNFAKDHRSRKHHKGILHVEILGAEDDVLLLDKVHQRQCELYRRQHRGSTG